MLAQLRRIFARPRRDVAGDEEEGGRSTAPLDVQAALRRMEGRGPPAVVVPIHNAPGEVAACIAALLKHTPGNCRILLMEDASVDRRVDEVLARFEGRPNLDIHRNASNVGFTRTVNRGIDLAGGADAVLLNSDTEVTPRWLDNLRLAAYSGEQVATATPLSNNAGAFSAPEPGRDNPLPDWLPLDDYARLVTQSSRRTYPAVPTGNGFCMYMRRDCIDRIGLFDADAFPRGYGEENDFCRRAARDGWSHVIDDATLIYHVRSASFGEARRDLLKQGRAVLDRRYPDYTRLVRSFEHDRRIQAVRQRIQTALAANKASRRPVRPRMLVAGGTAEQPAPPSGWELLVLRCGPDRVEISAEVEGEPPVRLDSAALPPGSEPMSGSWAEVEAVVTSWLVRFAVERARIAVGADFGVSLRTMVERLNIPVDPL